MVKITKAEGFIYDGRIFKTWKEAQKALALDELKKLFSYATRAYVYPSDIIENYEQVLNILKEIDNG